MSEIQHGVLPDLERRLQGASAEDMRAHLAALPRDEEEVAEVVSRWTGIPIAKMLEGDRENYCAWRRRCIIVLWGG